MMKLKNSMLKCLEMRCRCKKENSLKNNILKLLGLSILVLTLGGFKSLVLFLNNIIQVFIAFFPFFCEMGKIAFKEYITSPYFIVAVIMSVCSAFGIWFGVKGGKKLFWIVSLICEVLSLISIFLNVI